MSTTYEHGRYWHDSLQCRTLLGGERLEPLCQQTEPLPLDIFSFRSGRTVASSHSACLVSTLSAPVTKQLPNELSCLANFPTLWD